MFRKGVICFAVCANSVAWAGARIDLRKNPDIPLMPNQTVHVDVYLVDTGNPQGDIAFRGLQLDFSDNTGTLQVLGNPFFEWDYPNNIGIGAEFFTYPTTAWIWPITTPNPFMVTLPNNGEVKIGDFDVNIGALGGIVDVMNSDEQNPSLGAFATLGFGGPGDPVTTWRAHTGELTGGLLNLTPEPGSLMLVAMGVSLLVRRRRAAHRQAGA